MTNVPLPRHGWQLVRRFRTNRIRGLVKCQRCGGWLHRVDVLSHVGCPVCPEYIFVGRTCGKRLRGLLPNPAPFRITLVEAE